MAKKLKIFVAVMVLIGFVLSTMDVKKTLFGALVATGVIPKSLLQGKGMGGGGMPPTLVSAKTLEKTNGDSTSSYVGVVRYANVSTLSAEVSGKVESVKVREGSYIKKNQTIMELDKGKTYQDMLSAKADSEQASLAYKQAKRDFLRVKSLYAKEAISKQEFEANQLKLKGAEAKADSALARYNKLRIDLRNKNIKAPFDGVFIAKKVSVGEWVNTGTKVAVVGDTSKLKVETEVPYSTFVLLKEGMKVAVKVKNRTYKGTIYSVVSSSDEVSRAFPVKVWLDKTSGLYDGMEASVYFPNRSKDMSGYRISRDSIVRINKIDSIYVLKGNLAVPVAVDIIKFDGSDVIVSGPNLNDNTRVIVAGNERLMPNMPVRIDGDKAPAKEDDSKAKNKGK